MCRKSHAKSPGERGAWLCINLTFGKDFMSWLQSIHQLLILYMQEKFWGRGKTPPFFTADFSGNLMLKLLEEKRLLDVKNTRVNCHSVCIISDVTLYPITGLIVFYSVVLNQWSADSWGSWTAWDAWSFFKKSRSVVSVLDLLSKNLLHPRKTFCVCTKLKDKK